MNYLNLPYGIRVSKNQPVDADRYIATNLAARNSLITHDRAFEGLQVFIESGDTANTGLWLLTNLGIDVASSIWKYISTDIYLAGSGITLDYSVPDYITIENTKYVTNFSLNETTSIADITLKDSSSHTIDLSYLINSYVDSGTFFPDVSGGTIIFHNTSGDTFNVSGISYGTLSALTDTTINNPQDDEILVYSGGKWINASNTIIDAKPTEIVFNSGGTLTGSSNMIYDYDNGIIEYSGLDKSINFDLDAIDSPAIIIDSKSTTGIILKTSTNNPVGSTLISEKSGNSNTNIGLNDILFYEMHRGFYGGVYHPAIKITTQASGWTSGSFPTKYTIETISDGNNSEEERFQINEHGKIKFNDSYTFPSDSGLTNQVLTVSADSSLYWNEAISSLSGLTDTQINNLQEGDKLLFSGGSWINIKDISQDKIESNYNEIIFNSGGTLTGSSNLTIDSNTNEIIFHNEYTFPNNAGSNEEVLTQSGNGYLYWNKPITTLSGLTDTNINDLQEGNRLIFSGGKWINVKDIESNNNEVIFNSGGTLTGSSSLTIDSNTNEIIFHNAYTFPSNSGLGNQVLTQSADSSLYWIEPINSLSALTDTLINDLQVGDKLLFSGGSWINIKDISQDKIESNLTQIIFNSGGTLTGNSNLVYNYETNEIIFHSAYSFPTDSGLTNQVLTVSADSSLYWNEPISSLSGLTDTLINDLKEGNRLIFSGGSWINVKDIESNNKEIIFNSGGTLTGSSNMTYDYDDGIVNFEGEKSSVSLNLKENTDTTLEIKSNTNDGIIIDVANDSFFGPTITTTKSKGTQTSKDNIDFDILSSNEYNGYFGGISNLGASIVIQASGWTTDSYSTVYKLSTVSEGEVTLDERFLVNEKGEIRFNDAYTFPTNSGLSDDVLMQSGNGYLYWNKPINSLSALTDTLINNPLDGQIIVYENGEWINNSITEDILLAGSGISFETGIHNELIINNAKYITAFDNNNNIITIELVDGTDFDIDLSYLINTDTYICGGTFFPELNSGTITFYNVSGGSFDVSGISHGTLEELTDTTIINPQDDEILVYSGGKWINKTHKKVTASSGITIIETNDSIFVENNKFVTGFTNVNNNLSIKLVDDSLFNVDLSYLINSYVCGGTFFPDLNGGTITFTNTSGDTFNVSGVSYGTLSALTDTVIINPQNEQILSYDSVNDVWKNIDNISQIESNSTEIIFNSGGTLTGSSNLTFENGVLRINDAYSFPLTEGTSGYVLTQSADSSLYWQHSVNSLEGLTDTNLINQQTGQTLVYVNNKWVNKEIAENTEIIFNSGGTLTGSSNMTYSEDTFKYKNTQSEVVFQTPNANKSTLNLNSNTSDGFRIFVANDGDFQMPYFISNKSRGTIETPTNIFDDILSSNEYNGYFGGISNLGASIVIQASGWTTDSYSTVYKLSTISSGNTIIEERFFINDYGEIRFNDAYTFPTESGLTGYVLTQSADSSLYWNQSVNSLSALTDTLINDLQSGNTLVWNDGMWVNTGFTENILLGGSGITIDIGTPGFTYIVNNNYVNGVTIDSSNNLIISSPSDSHSVNLNALNNYVDSGVFDAQKSGGTITFHNISGDTFDVSGISSGTLSGLSDTSINDLQSGNTLVWNDGKWINSGKTEILSGGTGITFNTETPGYIILNNSMYVSAFTLDTSNNLEIKLADQSTHSVDLSFVAGATVNRGIFYPEVSGGTITFHNTSGGTFDVSGISHGTLSALTDTTINDPLENEILVYTGGTWVNSANTNDWLDNTLTASIDVGGVNSGESFVSGTTFEEMFLDLISPELDPTKTDNYVTISGYPTGILENGALLDFTLTETYNRGAIQSINGASIDYTGDQDTYEFSGDHITVDGDVDTTASTNTWEVSVDYSAGSGDYYTSRGNVSDIFDSIHLNSGTITNTVTIYSYHRYYYFSSGSTLPVYDIRGLIVTEKPGRTDNIYNHYSANNALNTNTGLFTFYYDVESGKSFTGFYFQGNVKEHTVYNMDTNSSISTSATTFTSIDNAAGDPVTYTKYEIDLGAGFSDWQTFKVIIDLS